MKARLRIVPVWLAACLCFAVRAATVSAQCAPHPSRGTTISVVNASNWPITFSIDGMMRATVPSAEVSNDFHVGPGEHVLLAEGSIEGEIVSVSRNLVVPAGSMCVWTVANPPKHRQRPPPILIDQLIRLAVIPLAIPNEM